MSYNIDAPIHSFRDMKLAVDKGEIRRPPVLPMLGLTDTTEIRSPLVQGWLILLSAKPKVGKSWLLHHTILGWEQDIRTLWFSEEGFSVWVEKAIKTPWTAINGDFAFAYAGDKDTKWMQEIIKQVKPQVVVIDTVKLICIEEENNPTMIRKAFQPYYNLAHTENITIILVHHDRKAEGQFGDQISGSNSFAGSVDETINIARNSQNEGDYRRLVTVSGRADNSTFVYELDKDTGHIVVLGDPADMKSAGLILRIKDALGVDELTTSQLRDIIVTDGKGEISKSVLGKLLKKMAEKGDILRYPDINETNVERITVRWTMKE